MLGYRLPADRHFQGEGCRRGVTMSNEQVEQLAARRIRDRRPELVIIRRLVYGDHAFPR